MASAREITAAEFLRVCCHYSSVQLPRNHRIMNEDWEFLCGK